MCLARMKYSVMGVSHCGVWGSGICCGISARYLKCWLLTEIVEGFTHRVTRHEDSNCSQNHKIFLTQHTNSRTATTTRDLVVPEPHPRSTHFIATVHYSKHKNFTTCINTADTIPRGEYPSIPLIPAQPCTHHTTSDLKPMLSPMRAKHRTPVLMCAFCSFRSLAWNAMDRMGGSGDASVRRGRVALLAVGGAGGIALRVGCVVRWGEAGAK